MTDNPTEGASQSGTVRLAVLLTVFALALFAGAIVWAGGIDGVAELLGLREPEAVDGIVRNPEIPATPGTDVSEEPAATDEASEEETEAVDPAGDVPTDAPAGGAAPQTTSGTSSSAAASAPSAAHAAMYREQLQSQTQLTKLANGEISQLTLGSASTSGTRSSVPVTVSYKSGGSVSGTMVLARIDSMWYFNSISGSGGQPAGTTPKRNINSSVVRTIVDQQATAANQDLITRGLVQGGFKSARVDGVTKGASTATVNLTLQGGTLDRRAARFVMISENDAGRKHWFVTRFELK
ncbi:MAG: hypothetical protein U1E29_00765 [Coriobacteriia bacterium]|nr:hypothetical protein [Coriobacteriia bacterium]